MNREDLEKSVKEKILFEGLSGEGKTFMSMIIAKIYAMNNKKVIYIDPDHGTDRSLKTIFGDLTDEQLNNIQMVYATDIETYLKYMIGYTEEKHIGSQKLEIKHGVDCDLKVCDGLTTEIEIYKTRLTQKFINQEYYEIGGTRFSIRDPTTFVLPYQFYAKLYDQIKEALVIMLSHNYDIICTMHPLKDTEAQKSLEQSIYQKFDSVIRLNKTLLPTGKPKWDAKIIKNRGRESPDKSNVMDDVFVLFKYFMKKFNMDVDKTMKDLIESLR